MTLLNRKKISPDNPDFSDIANFPSGGRAYKAEGTAVRGHNCDRGACKN
jgi:hypothetical protein